MIETSEMGISPEMIPDSSWQVRRMQRGSLDLARERLALITNDAIPGAIIRGLEEAQRKGLDYSLANRIRAIWKIFALNLGTRAYEMIRRDAEAAEEKRSVSDLETAVDSAKNVRIAFSFEEAIDEQTLLGDGNSEVAGELSPYESEIAQRETKIGLMLDLDGVLLETDEAVAGVSAIMREPLDFVEKIKKVEDYAAEHKIKISVLRKLLSYREVVADEPILITDRLLTDSDSFPTISRRADESFVRHGIRLDSGTMKLLNPGTKYLTEISARDITYYIGSSNTDETFAHKLWTLMERAGIPKEKLCYVEIRKPDGGRKIL